MSIKSEQKERSRETILVSAERLLRSAGIGGARVADVMKGAGLTVGGFYAHFGSKQALVDAALERTGAALRERLFVDLEQKPEADRAEVVLRRYLSAEHRDHSDQGCVLPAIVGEVATGAPEHQPALARQIEQLTAELAGHLPRSGALPRRHLALALVALMYGGLSLARALRGTPLSEELLRACRALGIFAARAELAAGRQK
jgi:TetR/AcrR family transcriptional repressor of nem operon